MGLVDHIDIHSLIRPKEIDHVVDTWQTKSLGCNEEEYFIDYDKYLYDFEGYIHVYTGEIRMKNDNYELVAWCVNGHVKEIVQV